MLPVRASYCSNDENKKKWSFIQNLTFAWVNLICRTSAMLKQANVDTWLQGFEERHVVVSSVKDTYSSYKCKR